MNMKCGGHGKMGIYMDIERGRWQHACIVPMHVEGWTLGF